MPFKILIIDDLVHDRRKAISLLPALLRREHYQVEVEADVNTAYEKVFEYLPDLVVLDIDFNKGKGGMDGFEVCQSIRTAGYRGKVIMRTEKRLQTDDAIEGYDKKADIYVKAPIDNGELVAMIRRQLPHNIHEFDERLCINVEMLRVCVKRDDEWQDAGLDAMPTKLLRELVLNRGRIVTRTYLNLNVWGDEEINEGTFDKCLCLLRQQIEIDPSEPKHVVTIKGLGYRFDGRPTRTHDSTPEGRQRCHLLGCG
jgi:DNA-binding response OmpR family regulator